MISFCADKIEMEETKATLSRIKNQYIRNLLLALELTVAKNAPKTKLRVVMTEGFTNFSS
jgi:hypothetical protein